MTDTRNFNTPNLNLASLTKALQDWFQFQNYQVQSLDLPNGNTVIQARQGGWRNILGLSTLIKIYSGILVSLF